MKKIILFFAVLFYFTTLNAQRFVWAKKNGPNVESNAITIDAAGNTYITGWFVGTVTFGTFTLVSYGGQDVFVVKYDPAGTVLWAKKGGAGGTSDDFGSDIEVDAGGNVLVTGVLKGPGTFDTFMLPIVPAGGFKMFMVKYNSVGVALWAKEYYNPIGVINGVWAHKMAVDQFGNSFVTGENSGGTLHFGADSIVSTGYSDAFIVKFDVNGNPVWARGLGGHSPGQDYGNSVAVDSSGNVFTSGGSGSDTIFSGSMYVVNNGAYLAKYNSTGVTQWIESFGGGVSFSDSDVDKYGNVYLTGSFSGVADFGNSIVLSPIAPSGDMFIAKYNTSGICQWGQMPIYCDDYEGGSAINVDRNDKIQEGGFFSGNMTIVDGYSFVADVGGNADGYVAEYDLNGNFHWAQQISGGGQQLVYGVTSNIAGNVFVTGSYRLNSTFGSITLTGGCVGCDFSFAAKLDMLTSGIISSPICAGASLGVPYTSTATFLAGNIFTAQLSDSAGTFLTPVNIGTLSSTSASGSIASTIPPTTFAGTNYHIRVTSTSPAITGSWTSTFSVIAAPPTPQICLVTVDSLSTANVVTWEKDTLATNIDSFRVYREVTTSVYAHIASVSFDSLSEYIDYGANPNVTSYRYQIGIVDSCGNLTDSSLWHSTIHLQVLGGGNLQWTLYAIESSPNPVVFYRVLRADLGWPTSPLNPISSTIPGGNTTFTDIAYASFPVADYRMDVTWGISCDPVRTLINTTRSNIKHQNLTTMIRPEDLLEELSVYPNPAENEVTIELSEIIKEANVQIFNSLGQKVFEENISSSANSKTIKHIDLNNHAKGVYTISIESNTTKVFKKLVIN